MTKPRILSGVQPTGNLHLGNYLGAIRNWVGLQDSHECLFMLADLHAITVPQNPADLTRNTRETAAAYIACGIDPKRSAIFPQSAVSMHSELAWILNCHTPLGWLNRMTQFKEKSHQGKDSLDELIKDTLKVLKKAEKDNEELEALLSEVKLIGTPATQISNFEARLEELKWMRIDFMKASIEDAKDNIANLSKAKLGLYAYPVLMAADILGYHATHVPVGEDQKQHLELSRDIAGAFNRAYGAEFFPLPEPVILPTAARIMSLRDGTKKMSKSDPSDYSRITLTDNADAIAKKIRKATSDSIEGVTFDEKARPEVANILTIYAALSGSTPEAVAAEFANSQTSAFKAALADLAVEKLSPITTRMRDLMDDHSTLDNLLKDGANQARAIAAPIFEETKRMVGFLRL